MSDKSCVIVGAGHAAAQLIASLVQEGWDGRITLVGEEAWLPYNRPPLSKSFLSGEKTVNDLLIRPAAAYDKFGVSCLTGRRAVSVDTANRQLYLDDGNALDYTHLAICTGGSPRHLGLPGSDLRGIHYLRGIDDVLAIRDDLRENGRVAIIGGGYIGLETAAMLRTLGLKVTVIEAADRLLSRVTAPAMSAFFRELHEGHGVEVVTGTQVQALKGGDRVEGVVCADGRVVSCDMVVAGIGIIPATALAQEAGLAVEDGILVDEFSRTSVPDIVAAGDCTRFFNRLYGRSLRLESVQNAVDQAKAAAATLCGKQKAYHDLPWFWSDQYDLKFQIAGLSQGHTDVVFRGEPKAGPAAECRFSAFYLCEGKVLAVEAVNAPQDFMFGKRLVQAAAVVDKKLLSDPEVSLKGLLPG